MSDTYTVTYQRPTASGGLSPVTIYTCKDLADYYRCIRLGEEGQVKIISVSRKLDKSA